LTPLISNSSFSIYCSVSIINFSIKSFHSLLKDEILSFNVAISEFKAFLSCSVFASFNLELATDNAAFDFLSSDKTFPKASS